ncbi:hypothetical protein PAUR_b1073 [Pseudoalteromonas aurantia 208]|uniref:Uncharacterized protein n=1 Tax=Pseudoalteromonas aurantia 208 TaxID=1314867 RepID=A0ABR9EMK9_9GAMM|nr:hypothetical protein [Pseudoalteromonas aurantia 208]
MASLQKNRLLTLNGGFFIFSSVFIIGLTGLISLFCND